MTFYLWKMMKMHLQKVISKKFIFCWCLKGHWRKLQDPKSASASGSISPMYGSADPDPDPHQNFMDPQHWLLILLNSQLWSYTTRATLSFYTHFFFYKIKSKSVAAQILILYVCITCRYTQDTCHNNYCIVPSVSGRNGSNDSDMIAKELGEFFF
jgi:hypothetical protein